MTVEEGVSGSEVFKVQLYAVTVVAAKVVQRKGNAWWTEKIKEAVQGKRRAYKKMLERNVAEEMSEKES